jgi:hypothetical protein
MAKATVAGEVLAYCMACRMDLAHVVMAMKGDQVIRCQCKTCKKEHNYKAPKGITEPGMAPPPKATTRKRSEGASKAADTVAVDEEWQKVMSQASGVPAKAYSAKTKFQAGEKIAHPMFGEGIVRKPIFPNKIEVLFRNDLKILIHGGTAS